MPFVTKARQKNDPSLRKPTAGLNKAEKKILDLYTRAFQVMANDLDDANVLRAITAAIEAGNPLDASVSFQWQKFIAALDQTVPELAQQIANSANLSAKQLPNRIKIASNFNAQDPRAIAWAQQRAGARIQGITQESQKAVAQTIANGLRTQLNRQEVVASIRRVIGLDARGARALGNFYEKNLQKYLEEGLTYEEADRKVRRLSEEYRKRLLTQRATRIARTETLAAANAGRMLSWGEADAQGLLPPNSVKRWKTATDERTCPVCGPMHNVSVQWQGTFSTGDLMPPNHPNCRCTAVIVPGDPVYQKSLKLVKARTLKNSWLFAKHAPGTHDQKTHGRKGGSSASEGSETSVGLFATPTKAGRDSYNDYAEKVEYYTQDEQFQVAAQQWQGEDYRRVQGGLLSGNPSPEARQVINKFDENMASLDDFDGDLFRGQTEGLDNLQVGDSFVSPLFQSTTTDPITAAGFSKSSGGVIGGIKSGESATILRIDPMDAKGVLIPGSQEFEIVLARGTTFTIDGISDRVINGVNMRIIDVTAETPDE